MKRILAVMLVAVCMLSLTACAPQANNSNDPERKDIRYTYNDAGQIVTIQRFMENSLTGAWDLTFTVEHSYGENGLLTQKLFYDEQYVERFQAQKNTYTYTAAGLLEQILMYDSEGDLFGTTTFVYREDGTISDKTQHYSKLGVGEMISIDGENKKTKYTYSVIYCEDTGAMLYVSNLFTTEERVENATYTDVISYYPNGTMRQQEQFHSGILATRITYPERVLSEGEVSEDGTIYLDSNTWYQPNGDGTYETLGLGGTTTTFYETGEIESVGYLCENNDYMTEEYYKSGQKSVVQISRIDQEFGFYLPIRTEKWYENGTQKSLEVYNESTKTWKKNYWDEEGNEITPEEP